MGKTGQIERSALLYITFYHYIKHIHAARIDTGGVVHVGICASLHHIAYLLGHGVRLNGLYPETPCCGTCPRHTAVILVHLTPVAVAHLQRHSLEFSRQRLVGR